MATAIMATNISTAARYYCSCGEIIPAARLKAKRFATDCIVCATEREQRGEVEILRRHDERTKDGGVVSTYYTSNSYIERQNRRLANASVSNDAYQFATGDDSETGQYFEEKEPFVAGTAYALSDVMGEANRVENELIDHIDSERAQERA